MHPRRLLMDIAQRDALKPAPPAGTIKRAGRGWFIISDSEDEPTVSTSQNVRSEGDNGDTPATSEPAFDTTYSRKKSTGNNKAPKSTPTLPPLNVTQRLKFLALDPLVDYTELQSVRCKVCLTMVDLANGRNYDLWRWNAHCIATHGRTREQVNAMKLQALAYELPADEPSISREVSHEPDMIPAPQFAVTEEQDAPSAHLHSPTSEELAKDERVREYDVTKVCCLDRHWVMREAWRGHVQVCKPLMLPLSQPSEKPRHQKRPASTGMKEALLEWPDQELETDLRVRSFTPERIQCHACGRWMGRDLRRKWAEHRIQCAKMQRRVQCGDVPREAEDPAAPLPADSELSLDKDTVSDDTQGYKQVFSGATREAIRLARAIEFDLDPLVFKVGERHITCGECNRLIKPTNWRSHCRKLHNRSEDEQTQLVLRARADALAASAQIPTWSQRRLLLARESVPRRSPNLNLADEELAEDELDMPMETVGGNNEAIDDDDGFLPLRTEPGSSTSRLKRRAPSPAENRPLDDTADEPELLPVPDDFSPITFRGGSLKTMELARFLESERDPLVLNRVKSLRGNNTMCRKCRRNIVTTQWRKHCRTVHGRSEAEQTQLILRARVDALAAAKAEEEKDVYRSFKESTASDSLPVDHHVNQHVGIQDPSSTLSVLRQATKRHRPSESTELSHRAAKRPRASRDGAANYKATTAPIPSSSSQDPEVGRASVATFTTSTIASVSGTLPPPGMPANWDAYIKHLIASGVRDGTDRDTSDSRELVPYLPAESLPSSHQAPALPSPASTTDSHLEKVLLVEVLLSAMGGEQVAQVSTEQLRQVAHRVTNLVIPAIAGQSGQSTPGLGRRLAKANRGQLDELLRPLGSTPDAGVRAAGASGPGRSISGTGVVRDSATSDSFLEDDEWCF